MFKFLGKALGIPGPGKKNKETLVTRALGRKKPMENEDAKKRVFSPPGLRISQEKRMQHQPEERSRGRNMGLMKRMAPHPRFK